MATTLHEQLQRALGESYLLEHELAPGGMSRLFVATETALERRVVVKLLPPRYADFVQHHPALALRVPNACSPRTSA